MRTEKDLGFSKLNSTQAHAHARKEVEEHQDRYDPTQNEQQISNELTLLVRDLRPVKDDAC